MRTPTGKECRHYHEDFHRGRNIQECRLIQENPESAYWQPSDCGKCQVPDILNANASHDLHLTLTVKTGILGFGRHLEVAASCAKHRISIDDPYVGCPMCNSERPGLDIFRQAMESSDDDKDNPA